VIELRYVVPEGTHVPPPIPRLQWRFKWASFDNWGIPCVRYGEWTDWQDVPVVCLAPTPPLTAEEKK